MSWKMRRIADIGRVVTGKTPATNTPQFYNGEYLFVTPTDLNYHHYYCRSTQTTITDEARSRHINQFVPENSVMFTCIGNTTGKCALASVECLTNQQINSIVPNDENDAKFIYYLLNNNINFLKGLGSGAATPIINKTTFENVKLSVPELPLQCKIASVLSAYDDHIENNRRRIQLLEESARLLYKEWFVYLRFPGHEHVKVVDGVPEGWKKTTAFEVMDVLSGGTPQTSVPEYWDGDIPFFTPKDTTETPFVLETEKYITEQGLKKCNSRLYPKDTLFITARGTVGKLSLAQVPMAMNQSCYALAAKEPLTQYFLFCALNATIDQFKTRAVGAVFDAIVCDTFKLIPFMMPVKGLIIDFTESIKPVFEQMANLLVQNKKLKQARDLLLPRMMNGEIEV